MTPFGKLLVFMNLIFSVVTGALIVFVFTTRANWVGALKHTEAQAKAAEAAYKNEKSAHDNDIKQKDATLKEAEAQLKQNNDRVAIAQGEAAQARELAEKQIALNRTATTQMESLQAELKQIESQLADPKIYGNDGGIEIGQLGQRQEVLSREYGALETEWLALYEQLEVG